MVARTWAIGQGQDRSIDGNRGPPLPTEPTPPTLCTVVHDLPDALAAASVAAERGVAICLVSAPAAAAHTGPAWFRMLLATTRAAYPSVPATGILDCADRPGDVMAALRAGIEHVHFTGQAATAARLAAIAHQVGAHLVQLPEPRLSLRSNRDKVAACRHWLDQLESAPTTPPETGSAP